MILAIALFCMFPTPQLSFQASPFCYSWFLPFERNVREDLGQSLVDEGTRPNEWEVYDRKRYKGRKVAELAIWVWHVELVI